MEPISTTIAAIAAVRGAVETASNIKDIGNSLEKVLEDKQKALALKGLATELDRKWGSGTWEEIKKQRKKLIAEKEAADQLTKENALKKAKADKIFWHNFWVETGKVAVIVLFAGIMIGFVYWAATVPKIR